MKNLTNEYNLSEILLNGVEKPTPGITVEDLIDSPRLRILKQENEYTEDIGGELFDQVLGEAIVEKLQPEDVRRYMYFRKTAYDLQQTAISIKGNDDKFVSMNKVAQYIEMVADFKRPAFLFNQSIEMEIEGRKLTGAVPMMDREKGILYDYKFCSSKKYRDRHVKNSWIKKLNVIAWMLIQQEIEVKEIRLVITIGNWRPYSNGMYPANYPKSKFFEEIVEMDDLTETGGFILAQMADHILCEEKLLECSAKDRWCDKSMWQVTPPKSHNPIRVDSSEEVIDKFIEKNNYKHKFKLKKEEVHGKPKRCPECVVREFCTQYQEEVRRETLKKEKL